MKWFEEHQEWGLVFLRLALGIVFFIHGIGKFFVVGPYGAGLGGTAGYFQSVGIPVPLFFAGVVAVVETLGGLAILLGLFTRWAALGIAIDMLVAILLVHMPKGFSLMNGGVEYPLVLFSAAVTLLFTGAGEKWKLEKRRARG
ncbi:DoxX family protein [Candidatus Woesearchaeota archaeon]|nr:DoxX family protein [Candidatus Woesearchaeota archaeon]